MTSKCRTKYEAFESYSRQYFIITHITYIQFAVLPFYINTAVTGQDNIQLRNNNGAREIYIPLSGQSTLTKALSVTVDDA